MAEEETQVESTAETEAAPEAESPPEPSGETIPEETKQRSRRTRKPCVSRRCLSRARR